MTAVSYGRPTLRGRVRPAGCGRRPVVTGSSPRFPLRYHSMVCIKNHLFTVGIETILNKELEFIFRSNHSDRTNVYSSVSEYTIRYILDIKP